MKIRTIMGTVVAIAIAACWVGCGGATGSSGDDSGDVGISESEATALSEQISNAAVNSMNSADFAASVNAGLQGETTKSVQCSQDGSTCTFNVPIDSGVNCTAGGRIAVLGSLTGTISNGSGILQIGATETITDWQCVTGYYVNGDPYISLSGTFSFLNGAPSTQQSLTISGGFKWGTTAAESCQIHLSTNFSTSGGGTTTGTVCGYSVNYSF